nr:hypothetical protein [uncultured Dysosmobacter sp.]
MGVYGCRILLKHGEAQTFFEKAMRPDIKSLERRDSFFMRIREELSCRVDGTDLVEDIPDIDISSLLSPKDVYSPAKEFLCSISLDVKAFLLNSAEVQSALLKSKSIVDSRKVHSDYPLGPDERVRAA